MQFVRLAFEWLDTTNAPPRYAEQFLQVQRVNAEEQSKYSHTAPAYPVELVEAVQVLKEQSIMSQCRRASVVESGEARCSKYSAPQTAEHWVTDESATVKTIELGLETSADITSITLPQYALMFQKAHARIALLSTRLSIKPTPP